MATNTDQLRRALVEYQQGVAQHAAILTEQFEELKPLWINLQCEYHSEGADELYSDWQRTAQWFAEYLETIRHLNGFLENRIEYLNEL